MGSTWSQSSQSPTLVGPSWTEKPETLTTSALLDATFVPPEFNDSLAEQVKQQAKQIEEQGTIIKALQKQLTRIEGDLHAHIDLVSTLQKSLNESQNSARKARTHASELARERDILNSQVEILKNGLSEEVKAKKVARQLLDSRMEEIQRRKSKFALI